MIRFTLSCIFPTMTVRALILILIASLSISPGWAATSGVTSKKPRTFYVDIKSGNDTNIGTLTKPFRTLRKALEVVDQRVTNGYRSDKIYLRSGVYRPAVDESVAYPLNLKGTNDNYSIISAMPVAPNTRGAIRRSSGQWYEKVVIDDSYHLKTKWMRTDDPNIWVCYPHFELDQWPNGLVRKARSVPITDNDKTPRTSLFTLSPYMVLQDGKPTIWVSSLWNLDKPGERTYNQKTGALYLWPYGNKDPNKSLIETWRDGPHMRFRGLLDGNMKYAAIEGIEFRMYLRLFRRHDFYKTEAQRIIQQHVLIKDNKFSYGWLSIFLDVVGNRFQGNFKPIWGPLAPLYNDRAYWDVKDNVFYRPSREVFQIFGPGHIFEDNEIIDHSGPWAGPMCLASAVNTRHASGAIIKNNFIEGNYGRYPIFLIELALDPQKHKNLNCRYGGQIFENNVFVNMSRGAAIYLGRGGCMLHDVTIRNNIFKNNSRGSAIVISSPQTQLKITNNTFYDQNKAIDVQDIRGAKNSFGKVPFGSMDSDILITNNVFMKNNISINPRLLRPRKKSNIIIKNNLFYKNNQNPYSYGKNAINANPLFRAPDKLDFSTPRKSPCRTPDGLIGASLNIENDHKILDISK